MSAKRVWNPVSVKKRGVTSLVGSTRAAFSEGQQETGEYSWKAKCRREKNALEITLREVL